MQVMKWLRVSLSQLPEMVKPLRVLLVQRMGGNVRWIKWVASKRTVENAARTFERSQAWHDTQDVAAHPVVLSHFSKGYEVLIFSDASNLDGGSVTIQVPTNELPWAMEDVEPPVCLGEIFCGVQLRWKSQKPRRTGEIVS